MTEFNLTPAQQRLIVRLRKPDTVHGPDLRVAQNLGDKGLARRVCYGPLDFGWWHRWELTTVGADVRYDLVKG